MVMRILTAIASDTVQSRCWVAVGTGHGQVEIQARPRRHATCKWPSRGRCLAHSPMDDGEPESVGASNTLPWRMSTHTRPAGLSSATSSSILTLSQRSHFDRARSRDDNFDTHPYGGHAMQGLMMEYPLTLTQFFERSRQLFARRTLATRVPGGPLFRYT